VQHDAWGVDVLVSASQKALMCPPGLGLVSVSDKAWKIIEADAGRALFYWDFRKARVDAAKGQTAFTPAVSLIVALREALRMIDEEGLAEVLARHQRLAAALRAGGTALGLSVFTRAPILSNTVSAFALPPDLDGDAIVNHMYARYGSVIAGSRNKLHGKVIRFGTMGYVDASDIVLDLLHLEGTLEDLGWPVSHGAAIAAAYDGLRRA
jgi:aspartate aminotransferase-like enzyme